MDERDRHAAHRMRHVYALVGDRAAVGGVDASEDLDQRRLAGAVLAQQGDDFAAADAHADIAEGLRSAKALEDVADLKHGQIPPQPANVEPSLRSSPRRTGRREGTMAEGV